MQAVKLIAAAGFVIALSFFGVAPCGKALAVDQNPRNTVTGGFGVTGIMAPETFIGIVA